MSNHSGKSGVGPAEDASHIFVVAYDTQAGRLHSIDDFAVDAPEDALTHLRSKQSEYAGQDNVEVTLLESTLAKLRQTHARYFVNAPTLAVSHALLKHVRRGREGGATRRRRRPFEL